MSPIVSSGAWRPRTFGSAASTSTALLSRHKTSESAKFSSRSNAARTASGPGHAPPPARSTVATFEAAARRRARRSIVSRRDRCCRSSRAVGRGGADGSVGASLGVGDDGGGGAASCAGSAAT